MDLRAGFLLFLIRYTPELHNQCCVPPSRLVLWKYILTALILTAFFSNIALHTLAHIESRAEWNTLIAQELLLSRPSEPSPLYRFVALLCSESEVQRVN